MKQAYIVIAILLLLFIGAYLHSQLLFFNLFEPVYKTEDKEKNRAFCIPTELHHFVGGEDVAAVRQEGDATILVVSLCDMRAMVFHKEQWNVNATVKDHTNDDDDDDSKRNGRGGRIPSGLLMWNAENGYKSVASMKNFPVATFGSPSSLCWHGLSVYYQEDEEDENENNNDNNDNNDNNNDNDRISVIDKEKNKKKNNNNNNNNGMNHAGSQRPPILFVVAHEVTSGKDYVFTFLIDTAKFRLTFLRAYHHPLFKSLNDVAPLTATSFYVTNDHGTRNKYLQLLEDVTGIGGSNVVYFEENVDVDVDEEDANETLDDKGSIIVDAEGLKYVGDRGHAKIVISNLAYANGISTQDKDGYVFVAETTKKRVNVYDKNLTYLWSLDIMGFVDNIDIDPSTNVVVVGAHQKPLDFLLHALNASHLSPSMVVSFNSRNPTSGNLEKPKYYRIIHANDGSLMSGSSVGLINTSPSGSQRLYVGSVFSRVMLDCSIPKCGSILVELNDDFNFWLYLRSFFIENSQQSSSSKSPEIQFEPFPKDDEENKDNKNEL